MMRKMMIVIAYRFAASDAWKQALFAMIVISVSCMMTYRSRPYYSEKLWKLEVSSLIINAVTLGIGIILDLTNLNDSTILAVAVRVG